ncbi:hypothetical protein [Maribacter ulvicola]|uniref:Uncharacterized protein n=1 Tax=Maribacter ulvicola TaxID=228959 RepID=A0A1N6PML1_9FLAO|nr:hypothetical protein [Maribacter ulvicola]SIQ05503.1 hypothetical protein SAMN05421797_101513 [Maribacter ulvicola]
MKYVFTCFLIFSLCLYSCSSQKKLQVETPFKIGKATCQQYTSGREESGSGTELRIPVLLLENSGVELNEVYFRGKQVKAIVNTVDNQKMIVVRISKGIAKSSENLDLELNTDEAIISYNENGRIKYAKVNDIKQKQPLIYKGAPKN